MFNGNCVFVFDLNMIVGLGTLSIAVAGVVAVDAGVDPWQGAHTALVSWVETCGAELQFIIARNLDEGTPPEGPFKTGPKPEIWYK